MQDNKEPGIMDKLREYWDEASSSVRFSIVFLAGAALVLVGLGIALPPLGFILLGAAFFIGVVAAVIHIMDNHY